MRRTNLVYVLSVVFFFVIVIGMVVFSVNGQKRAHKDSTNESETVSEQQTISEDNAVELTDGEYDDLLSALQGTFEASANMTNYMYTISGTDIRIVASSNGKAIVYDGTFVLYRDYIDVTYGSGMNAQLSFEIEEGNVYIDPLPQLTL